MRSLEERLRFAYEGGLVTRFHTRMGITRNTTAQHSHGVAMLCYFLAQGRPSANLLMAALTHDLAEQAVGDIPSPTKWYIKELVERDGCTWDLDQYEQNLLDNYGLAFARTLAPHEQNWLHLADAMDGLLHCATELSMGNRRVCSIGERWAYKLRHWPELSVDEADVVGGVLQIWKEAVHGHEPQNFNAPSN